MKKDYSLNHEDILKISEFKMLSQYPRFNKAKRNRKYYKSIKGASNSEKSNSLNSMSNNLLKEGGIK